MSIVRPLLNMWLRRVEKPYIARTDDPAILRAGFRRKARLYFHAPRGMLRETVTLGSRPTLVLKPKGRAAGPDILYFHGGAYIFGDPGTHAALLGRLLNGTGGRAVLPDYSKAPEVPFPAAVHEAREVWREMLDQGVDPTRTVIGGDSAGGGLALALLALCLEQKLPVPAGVFAISPLTDMTFSGQSIVENAQSEAVLPTSQIPRIIDMYLAGHDPKDPHASPLLADFTGAPPVHLMVSDTEILRDDTIRLRDRLQSQGVPVRCDIAHDLPHVWPMFHNTLPEARHSLKALARWIRGQTGHAGGS